MLQLAKSKTASLYMLSFPNGKAYIGIAINIAARFRSHRVSAKTGKGFAVHKAIALIGWDRVVKNILCVGSVKFIKEMEKKAIVAFNTRPPNGYNLTAGGDGAEGKEFSAQDREARRERMIGNQHTKGKVYTAEEMSFRKKWNHKEETKKSISASNLGKKRSDEAKENCSIAAKIRWQDPEQIRLHSERCKLRASTEEGRKFLSEISKGKVVSEGQRKEHSERMKMFYETKRNGEHNMSMGEWFASLKSQSK